MSKASARIAAGTPILDGAYVIGAILAGDDAHEVYAARTPLGAPRAISVWWRDAAREADDAWRITVDAATRAHEVSQQLDRLIGSPHVVRIFEVRERPSAVYLVMELAESSLDDVILQEIVGRGLAIPTERALHWIRALTAGLKALHDAGWAHGGIDPSSALLFDSGERLAVGSLHRAVALGTTPRDRSARSPAVAERVRDDIRTVGALSYELLTGYKHPPADVAGELAARRPDLPQALVVSVRRMLGMAPMRGVAGSLVGMPHATDTPLDDADAVLAALPPEASHGPEARSQHRVDREVKRPPRAARGVPSATDRLRLGLAVAAGVAIALAAWWTVSRVRDHLAERRGEGEPARQQVADRVAPRSAGEVDAIMTSVRIAGLPAIVDASIDPDPFDPLVGRLPGRDAQVLIDPRISAPVDIDRVTNLSVIDTAFGLRITPEERQFLATNGFVMKRLADTALGRRQVDGQSDESPALSEHEHLPEMHALYALVSGEWDVHARRPENSVLLTTDLYLSTFMRIYSELQKEIENEYFFPSLKAMTARLFTAANERVAIERSDDPMRAKWTKVRDFLAVPRCLLDSAAIPPDGGGHWDNETDRYVSDEEVLARFLEDADPSADSLEHVSQCIDSLGLEPDSEDAVRRDVEQIYAARAGDATPAVFGDEFAALATETGLTYVVDFSLFQPKASYTSSSLRRQYLRAATWYGQVPFLLRSPALTSYAFALAELLAEEPASLHNYAKTQATLSFLIGEPDDLGALDYVRAAAAASASADPARGAAEHLAGALQPRIKGLAARRSLPDVARTADVTIGTMGMRFLPQAGTPDNYWLARLTQGDEAVLPGYAEKLPPMASSLEVMRLLGSDHAGANLGHLDFYSPAARAVDKALAELATETGNYPSADWERTAYSNALWSLQALFTWSSAHRDGLPMFARSAPWDAKTLQTASGAWTELRHVAVVHAKQVFAETSVTEARCGGGGGDPCDPRPIPSAPRGYIEPSPEFFERLGALASRTSKGLSLLGYGDLSSSYGLATLADACDASRDYVLRELRNAQMWERIVEQVREDPEVEGGVCTEVSLEGTSDWEALRRDIVSSLGNALPTPIESARLSPTEKRAAVIADLLVGGDESDPTRVLYEATGVPNVIVAIVDDANGPRAVIGFTYSHYEFLPNNVGQSLTDEWWQKRFYLQGDEHPYAYTDRALWPQLNPWYRDLFVSP